MIEAVRLIFFGVVTVAMAAPAIAITPAALDEPDTLAATRLTLVDDAISEEGEVSWRLDPETFAPEQIEGENLRLRLKVRPNRAMGRMSLSF